MSAKQTWIVLASGNASLEKISEELKEKGFTIDSTLDAIGQIVVKGTAEMKKEAGNIKGISAIYPSQDDINIGQPGEGLTW